MYTGCVQYDAYDVEPSVLARHLAVCLHAEKAANVVIQGNRVTFTGGLFRLVSNWNLLVPFGRGELEIDPIARQVRFRLSFAELIVVASVLIALMSLAMISSDFPAWFAAMAIPFLWIWLVGANLAIGIPRFHSFLRRAIAKSMDTI